MQACGLVIIIYNSLFGMALLLKEFHIKMILKPLGFRRISDSAEMQNDAS